MAVRKDPRLAAQASFKQQLRAKLTRDFTHVSTPVYTLDYITRLVRFIDKFEERDEKTKGGLRGPRR